MNFITIDPGISGTGWASIEDNKLEYWGIIRPKGLTWEARVNWIVNTIYMDCIQFGTGYNVFIEWPTYQSLVAQNTQAIPKLAYLIGRIYQFCETMEYKPKLLPVSLWRGSCPKEVLWKRAEKFFGKKGFKSHSGDAVAIAQFILQNKYV